MLFRVDALSSEPIFEQLAHQIRVSILHGDLTPGSKLPTARNLAEALEVNLHTVLHAYQILRDEGHIELRRGRGAIVTSHSEPVPTEVTHAITQLITAAQNARLTPQTVLALVKEAIK
jgi:GntR family transcriptional regulator